MHILGDVTYLPRLRLLHWDAYPRKSLPPTFQPECLVELYMQYSKLEKLWGGIQPLANLKKLNLDFSTKLKEIPNLSKATNLETLRLQDCTSLVELPSSIRNLHKLEQLDMSYCLKLRVIPTNINLASLRGLNMVCCSRLRTFPDFSSNINYLDVKGTKIEDVPASVARSWLYLDTLYISSTSLKRLTNVPESVRFLDLSYTDIKRIPDCVTGLPRLCSLSVKNCKKLVSLQSLPPSLWDLDASDCESLKSVCFLFDEPRVYITLNDCKCLISEKDAIRVSSRFYHPNRRVTFHNCLKLDEEARRVIIQRWAYRFVCLPGKEIPAEFTHKAKGNSITISPGTFSASSRFKACLLFSPTEQVSSSTNVVCRLRSKGVLINELSCIHSTRFDQLLTEHLLVFSGALFKEHRCLEVDMTTREIFFEFSCQDYNGEIIDGKIIECGVQILAEEGEMDISSSFDDPNRSVTFPNCLSLDEEARRMIIQRWVYRYVFLPGKEMPAEFTHKAKGNSITISPGTFSASSRFKACILLSTAKQFETEMVCRLRSKGVLINELKIPEWQGVSDRFWLPYPQLLTEHLFVVRGVLFKEHRSVEVDATTSEILFEFSCGENNDEIIECGVEMLAEEGESCYRQWKEQSDGAVEVSKDESIVKSSNHTGWWTWLRKLGLKKKKKMINKT